MINMIMNPYFSKENIKTWIFIISCSNDKYLCLLPFRLSKYFLTGEDVLPSVLSVTLFLFYVQWQQDKGFPKPHRPTLSQGAIQSQFQDQRLQKQSFQIPFCAPKC